jgi:hypothetical protein
MQKKGRPMRCKDCNFWYGGEEKEIGPCSIKHMRGEKAYLTHGMFSCDEEENH